MNDTIIDTGRGPQIAGTRITVFHVMDYLRGNWQVSEIASWLRITVDKVEAAIAYIEAHRAELEPVYEEMLERDRRGNPPEVQAKLDELHAKYAPIWEERKRILAEKENGHARNTGGQQ